MLSRLIARGRGLIDSIRLPQRLLGGLRLRDFPQLIKLKRDAARRDVLRQKPDLTYLFWESTLRCNLRCAHCGSSCETRSPRPDLTTEQVLAIVDSIAEDFDSRRIFVSITGGEPLLRKDLDQVVERMTVHGMRSCIVSNGTLLTEERARRLVDAGMRTVTISVDGLEREHDAVRGEGTYGRTLAALGNARRAGMTTVEAITCVRPANLADLAQIERTVCDAGANLWRVITIDKMGRAGHDADEASVAAELDADLWLDPPQINQLLDYVAARRAAGAPVRFSCGGFLGVDRELTVRPESGQCYAGLAIASILHDGSVSACPSLPRSWIQGSALETRFSTIWRERFQRYRDVDWRESDRCQDCSYFDICAGGGLHERAVQPDDFCWLDRQGK
jgi:radical SAM protein with 4Fe4S-binding SPASM domain